MRSHGPDLAVPWQWADKLENFRLDCGELLQRGLVRYQQR